MSLLATILLSGTSVLVGITNSWRMTVYLRKWESGTAPRTDVVIRWPNYSYLVVQCDQDIARHLFFAPEQIDYALNRPNGFIFMSLLGTLFLMTSVIALANAKIQLQLAWAGSYILLNVAHWLAAALPRKLNWDFSALTFEERGMEGGPQSPTYTEALWKVILFTKSADWARRGKAVPEGPVWDEWLIEAEKVAESQHCHRGTLENSKWVSKEVESIIYEAPKDWNPKEAWERIRAEYLVQNEGQRV
ncbi:hypothetical protein PRZ48_000097 [Zasmidium cellare]|uniref:Uncharacterized protein n=1 Tax=Zasmidium cellare TaxID=395010 RepID=A0ABR0EXL9_ZASCE|nr:hypothetical protein PRZ48_000097 [Zasmidium cellare]